MKEIRAIGNIDDMTDIIKSELENIAEGFIAVGYYLKKTRDDELYKQKGFSSIYEYAKSMFGIGRTTAIRFMEINDTYSVGGYSPQIEVRYRGYGSSKLTEMLGLPEEIREAVPVEATVKDIREAKGVVKETEKHYYPQMELCDVAPKTEEIMESWPRKLVREFFRENKNAFEKMVDWVRKDIVTKGIEEDVLAIVNPTKFKMLRFSTANVMMQEKVITVMPYRNQGEKETFGYIEFAKAFEELFFPNYPDVSESMHKIYEREYGVAADEKKEETKEPVRKEAAKDDSRPVHKAGPEPEPKKTIENPVEITSEQDEKEEVKEEAVTDCNQLKADDDQIPGQTELTKDFPQYCPPEMTEGTCDSKLEAEIEVPAEECMNRPYKTRREYMAALSEEEKNIYMAVTMGELFRTTLRNTSVQVLMTVCFWESFFSEEVDENGNTIIEA